jgi:hypothetical protein
LSSHPSFAAEKVGTAGDVYEERIGSFRILNADQRAVTTAAVSQAAEESKVQSPKSKVGKLRSCRVSL